MTKLMVIFSSSQNLELVYLMSCWYWLKNLSWPTAANDNVQSIQQSRSLTLDIEDELSFVNDYDDPLTPEEIAPNRFPKSKSQPHIFKSSQLPELNRKDLLHYSEHNPHVGYFLLHSDPGRWSRDMLIRSRRLTPRPILKAPSTMRSANKPTIRFSQTVSVSSPVGSSWCGDTWQPPEGL